MNLYFWIPVGLLVILLIAALVKRYQMFKNLTDAPDSDKLILLTDANFEKTISKGLSLVDFWAPWCAPCKILGPIVSEVAESIGGKAKICKLDVEQNKVISAKLKIRNIPTIIIFKDGEPVKQFVGVKSKTVLLKAINSLLN